MKQVGVFPWLALAMMGAVQASTNNEALSSDHAVSIEEGNDYIKVGTKYGVDSGLAGAELDAYVEECAYDLRSGDEASTGEDS